MVERRLAHGVLPVFAFLRLSNRLDVAKYDHLHNLPAIQVQPGALRIYRGMCGQGQYATFDYSAAAEGTVPFWVDVHDARFGLPYKFEPECREYPLGQLPQGGHVQAKSGGAFDWQLSAQKEVR